MGVGAKDRPIANPLIVLREEFDDWAVLFDADSGNAFGINPVGVFTWRRLDGHHAIEDILKELRESCQAVPEQAKDEVRDFIQSLIDRGLAGYEVN